MITFKIGENEINMVENWTEITLNQYIEIHKLDKLIGTFLFDEIYYIRLLEVLCNVSEGGLDDMDLDMMNALMDKVKFTQEAPTWSIKNYIEHNGTLYVFPSDFNKLTMGEYISIKTIQQGFDDLVLSIPKVLPIILRPGKKILVDGEERYIQDKFEIESLEKREKDLMSIPIIHLMGPIGFFLNGKKN
jgi:hypothetical protein